MAGVTNSESARRVNLVVCHLDGAARQSRRLGARVWCCSFRTDGGIAPCRIY